MIPTLTITLLHPSALDLLGAIPSFLSEHDTRTAASQFNDSYAHGGGWQPMSGWAAQRNESGQLEIQYPDDPTYRPVAMMQLRDETIWIYQHAWVAIEQADGSVEISRMD